MVSNPFSYGNPIREPDRFYGRRWEVHQIVGRLLSSAFESTSVVGERRLGKTSLLNYLSHPQVAPTLGLTPDKYVMVYIDFQGLADITPTRFWQRVLGKISRSLEDDELRTAVHQVRSLEEIELFDLEDLFDLVSHKGLKTVLLFDEF
jgi:AAA+ ATPase superfamily predicted ATPase